MQVRATVFIVSSLWTATLLLNGCATQSKSTNTPAPPPVTIAPTPAVAPPTTMVAPKVRTAADIGMAEILSDPKKLAVLRKYAPSLANNPQLSMVRGMTLADVAGYSESGLSASALKAMVDDLNRF